MTEPLHPVTMVATQPSFDELCQQLSRSAIIGLDVETTLDDPPSLCTIQLATARENYIVDALAFDDIGAIADLLANRNVVKVIHYAPFERSVFRQYGYTIKNVYDTCQISRRLRRTATGGHSLLAVCRRELGVELDKFWQTSDWTQRPLDPAQLDYAALDAEVLVRLHAIFTEETLQRHGQRSLLRKGAGVSLEQSAKSGSSVDVQQSATSDPSLAVGPPLFTLNDEQVFAQLRAVLPVGQTKPFDELVVAVGRGLGYGTVDGKTAAVLRGFFSRARRQGLISEQQGMVRRA